MPWGIFQLDGVRVVGGEWSTEATLGKVMAGGRAPVIGTPIILAGDTIIAEESESESESETESVFFLAQCCGLVGCIVYILSIFYPFHFYHD